MSHLNFRYIALLLLLIVSMQSYSMDKITIHMAGDSTMSLKEPQDFPETGWGMPFALMFDDSVNLVNYAANGRSSKSFIIEGRWQKLISRVKEGDYVIIQFGHNDEFESKGERYTKPEEFKANLKRFIAETRNAKASPILLSSVTRRHFDKQGKIEYTHPHAPFCVEVAKETGVFFIDMDSISRAHFQEMGDSLSALRFLHVPPNTLPNYPNGVRDDTHLNQLGAREVAQWVVKALQEGGHPLTQRLRKPTEKQKQLRY